MGFFLSEAANDETLTAEKRFQAASSAIHNKLVEMIDISKLNHWKPDRLQRELRQLATRQIEESELVREWDDTEKDRLLTELMSEMFGFGPLDKLMTDPAVSDILVNGPNQVFIERNGRLVETNAVFADNAHLLRIIQRIAARVGRRADESSPMVDARLPDGSRVNAIIPPLSLEGAVLSIRRFGVRLTVEDLLENNTAPPEMISLLRAAVSTRISVLVSGGTGSGKTTLLNVLSRYIPRDERLVTIEDSAELKLNQRHVIRLETRPPNLEGAGEVKQRDLVRNALRMRPDRIILGEVRGAEALDMLQAMNTGHEGSLTTIHANDTRDALARLEMMVMMAGFELPVPVIRQYISSAITLIIQLARLKGGRRKIVRISEIQGIKKRRYVVRDLFGYKQTGVAGGHAGGHFYATGNVPRMLARLKAAGVSLPATLFTKRILEEPLEAAEPVDDDCDVAEEVDE
jgi:pilus assembly protein CpaF